MPPRDYFTDEVRRQFPAALGKKNFSAGGLSIRATIDPEMQVHAAHALQRALEDYDRGLGRLRTTGQTIAPDLLADEAWRSALAELGTGARHHAWRALVSGRCAGCQRRARPAGDRGRGGGLPCPPCGQRATISIGRAGRCRTIWKAGDVVYVRASPLTVTAVSSAGLCARSRKCRAVHGDGCQYGPRDRHAGRLFSYQHSVFNRATQAQRQPGSAYKPFVYAAALDSGFTPATIIVDAPIEIETPQGLWRPTNASNQFYGPTPCAHGD
jgi:penicillin-binding protein 1A